MSIERKFMITINEIERMRALYNALDNSEWHPITYQDEEGSWCATGPVYNNNSGPGEMDDFNKARNDAQFISAAKALFPRLLDEIEHLYDLIEYCHGSCYCCATY